MRFSRVFGLMAGSLFLCACSMNVGKVLDIAAPSGGQTTGVVVGDEPFAVQAGAAALEQGGSAADAVTAMYFALTVAYPVSAGLGGGGLCVVHDPVSARNEEFDFLPRDAVGGGAYAVPGAVRGFAGLQGAYGVLPWQRDVAPAESLANGGFPISEALMERLAQAQDVIRLDAALSSEFLDESGRVKSAGTTVSNHDLGTTLAAIRTQGAQGFYAGPVAAGIIAYSAAQGGAISASDLASYAISRHAARAVQLAGETIYVPDTSTGAGAFIGAVFDNLRSLGVGGQSAVVDAVRNSLATFGVSNLPKDMGSTGFAAVDARGQAVACAVTMDGPFGSGHTAASSGIVLARAPGSGAYGLASAFLTPILAGEGDNGPITLAGVGAGGPNGAAAITYALLQSARTAALLRPGDLRSTGAAPFETVNIVNCRDGDCIALNDPGGNGTGAAADTGQ